LSTWHAVIEIAPTARVIGYGATRAWALELGGLYKVLYGKRVGVAPRPYIPAALTWEEWKKRKQFPIGYHRFADKLWPIVGTFGDQIVAYVVGKELGRKYKGVVDVEGPTSQGGVVAFR